MIVSRSSTAEISVVDTSILIDHLRGYEPATALLRALVITSSRDVGGLIASEITRFEVLADSRDPVLDGGPAAQLFDSFDWIPVTSEIAVAAGDFARRFRYGGSPVGPSDCLIAATASVLGAELLTVNTDNFPMFPGIVAPYGYA